DKIWHDVNFTDCRIEKEEERVAQARLFFPETAGDIGEDLATADRRRVHEGRRARGRINRRAVTDDKQRSGRIGRHEENVERPTPNVQYRINDSLARCLFCIRDWAFGVGRWTFSSSPLNFIMRFRTYKNTDLRASEVGFGLWTI